MAVKISAVVVAAGASGRMGSPGSKLLMKISGKTVVRRSLEALEQAEVIDEIVLVIREEDRGAMLAESAGIQKLSMLVPGGENRQASVLNGVLAASGEYVAIHDGARPLVTPQEIQAVCGDGVRYGAATLSCVPKDTIKTADEKGFVAATPRRDGLRLIATPQVFTRAAYLEAAGRAEKEGRVFTDDCQLIEAAGGSVYLTPGKYTNLKITTPEDILMAEAVIKGGKGGSI